jgi:hypothetical protein
LEFWFAGVFEEKLPHVPGVLRGKSLNPRKLPLQITCELLDHRFSSTLALLALHYHTADVPVEFNKLLVDGLKRLVLGGSNSFFDFS